MNAWISHTASHNKARNEKFSLFLGVVRSSAMNEPSTCLIRMLYASLTSAPFPSLTGSGTYAGRRDPKFLCLFYIVINFFVCRLACLWISLPGLGMNIYEEKLQVLGLSVDFAD